MYEYSLQQWMMFFFIYCFLGWVWESCYVSAKKRKWVNRGFLHGAWLPIYGSGAIAVLLLTLPVKENLFAVYVVGMIGATILEYITGAVMERIFHVRYWDYSNQKWNLHGYICLTSSVAWGFFSVGLIRYIHHPIEDLVEKMPEVVLVLLDGILLAAFCVDTVMSVREAFDLKAIILAEKEKELQLLQRSLAVVAENLEERSQRIREELEEGSQKLREGLEESSQRLHDSIHNRRMEEREKLLLLKTELEQRRELLNQASEKRYKNARRILRRNPGTTFQKVSLFHDFFVDKTGKLR